MAQWHYSFITDKLTATLSVPTEAEADRFFAALADGGQVGDAAGRDLLLAALRMVNDRFGVCWVIIVPQPGAI